MEMLTVAVYPRRENLPAVTAGLNPYEETPSKIVRAPSWAVINAKYPEPQFYTEEIELEVIKAGRMSKDQGRW
jgi:hypothetical protein